MSETAFISKISHGSYSDGEGIRTVVFFAGCGLNCRWCHNPESIPANPVLMHYRSKCIACGKCTLACPDVFSIKDGKINVNRQNCNARGVCTRVCLSDAIQLSCTKMTADEVFSEIAQDKAFYKHSGGGATFSGGECLLASEFLARLLNSCAAEGINTCIETSLDVPLQTVENISSLADSFLVDIKHINPEKHREYTDRTNERILSNIRHLFAMHDDVTFRVPLIPGVNDSLENLYDTVKFVHELKGRGKKRIEILRYNNLARSKYESIDKEFICFGEPQSDKALAELISNLDSLYDDVHVF